MVYLRDKCELKLTPTFLVTNLGFIKLLYLAERTDIPSEKRFNLMKYFDALKEYERDKILNVIDTKYKEEAYIQHGYITMQFTEILGFCESMLHSYSLGLKDFN